MTMTTAGPTTSIPAARPASRWLLPVVLLGNMLNTADVMIVNGALPTVSRALHAGPAALELVVAGYLVAYACLLVVGGRLGDMYGRRRLFVTGMAGFTLMSAACGLAPTAGVLIAARIAQGATAALMVPQVLATIQIAYTGRARQRALGIFGAGLAIAAAVGLILGGVIVSADIAGLSWRPAFLINVPIGIAGVIVARRVVPDSRADRPAPIDARGAALLGLTIVALLVPLSLGRDEGWPWWCWAVLAGAPVAGVAFAAAQRRSARGGGTPLLPPALLRATGMRRGLLLALALFPGYAGLLFATPVTLQAGLGASALTSSLTLVPYAVAFLIGSLLTRRLFARYDRSVMVAGALVLALANGVLAVQAAAGYSGLTPLTLAPALMVVGVAQSLVAVPLFGVVLSEVPAEQAGLASGVLVTTQQIALSLGVAGIGTLFFTLAADHGYGAATVTVEVAQAALALAAAAVACALPHPR
ncbi:MAG TPA: MFS transporter [Streptosporangiaceae bacterium]|jgi:MFS family permease